MSVGRVLPIVGGCVLMLPALGLVAAGGGLGAAQLWQRGRDGYFEMSIERLESSTPAVVVNDVSFATHSGTPRRLLDSLHADIRLRVTGVADGSETFVGIGRDGDVADYLSGVAHSRVTGLGDGMTPVYQTAGGDAAVSAPTEHDFWVAAATGSGTQELEWSATNGNWSIVVMNADGSPGVSVAAEAGLRVASLGTLAAGLAAGGTAIAVCSVALILAGVAARELRP